jgi:predicted nuclease of predicted toxin-antitoxin system
MSIAAYPNENREGREQLWRTSWQLRKTYATAIASIGAAAVEVSDLGLANNDDLVRLRAAAGVTEEYQRVTGRDVANNEIDVDETLINALAINDNVMFVTEIIDAPVRNNSATPGEEFKVFLEIFNEDATQAVVVGYEVLMENVGGGIPV